MITTVLNLYRQLHSTVIRWASSLWPTRVWRRAAARWCLMPSGRIRSGVYTTMKWWIQCVGVQHFLPFLLQIVFVFQSPLNPGNEGKLAPLETWHPVKDERLRTWQACTFFSRNGGTLDEAWRRSERHRFPGGGLWLLGQGNRMEGGADGAS